eukprot:SAG11_NODE_4743_length_1783_cov_9.289786_2_plen_177_part_00
MHVVESNWSDHAVVISKARNRLHPSRSIKMVYIKSNHRALGIVNAAAVELKTPADVTVEQVRGFLRSNRQPHKDFQHPTGSTGDDLCTWGSVEAQPVAETDGSDSDVDDGEFDELEDEEVADDVCADEQFDYPDPIDSCPDMTPQYIEVRKQSCLKFVWQLRLRVLRCPHLTGFEG